jgi:hypothetical protein
LGPKRKLKLSNRLEEGQGLNIAHGTANFHDGHIDSFGGIKTSAAFDEVLYFVGDVRNDLNRFAQVITATFFFKHALVNLARGEVVGLLHSGVDEALVVAQVEVGLCAIVCDKHFTVLKR